MTEQPAAAPQSPESGPGSEAESGPGSGAEPEPRPTPTPPPTPVRRGESQKDIERGIIRWMFVFFFATHLIGGAIWLAIYLTGNGGG